MNNFNWDNISVGDFNVDHSLNYFSATNKENANANLINILKTPIGSKQTDNGCEQLPTAERIRIPLVWDSPKEDKELKLDIKDEPEPEQQQWQTVEDEEVHYKPSNLKLEWSIANKGGEYHGTNDAVAPSAGPAPRAYAFKDVYQHNRAEAQRKRDEEERRARQFHSKPMPNFRAHHKRLDDAVVVHKITAPVTPNVVKHGLADRLRRKQKEEMLKQAEQEKAKGKKEQIQTKKASLPFQLHSEQRARERREYDAAVKTSNECKKRQQEEERLKREQEEKKELRKMTEFRARPNPFK